jgi:hypothetical protein
MAVVLRGVALDKGFLLLSRRTSGKSGLATFPLRIQKAALERPDASRDVVSN